MIDARLFAFIYSSCRQSLLFFVRSKPPVRTSTLMQPAAAATVFSNLHHLKNKMQWLRHALLPQALHLPERSEVYCSLVALPHRFFAAPARARLPQKIKHSIGSVKRRFIFFVVCDLGYLT